jgi:hypothetical protein
MMARGDAGQGSVQAKKDDMVSRELGYGRRQFFVVSC